MGYLTRYEIEIESGELAAFEAEMISRNFMTLEKLVSREILGDGDKYNLFDGGETKWYDHHEDMIEFSKKHPNAVFLLSGEGEEQGDIWKAYYKNGKGVKLVPELKWPEYNESMLE